MARTKKQPRQAVPTDVLQDPKRLHELLGLPGPYEPPPAPVPMKGFVAFWDCGISINELRRRKPDLFPLSDWLDGARFAKDSDSWKWREIDPTPVGQDETFEEQAKKLPHGYGPPAARELVTYLVVRFLTTGERLEIPRLRTKDVTPSGRRVCVGPFRDSGLEVANVSDRWASPGIALCRLFSPVVPPKK